MTKKTGSGSKNFSQELLSLAKHSDFDLSKAKRQTAKKLGVGIPNNAKLLADLTANKTNLTVERLKAQLKKRAIRTASGIAPVAVLTAPYTCPGHCAYCPTEKNVPTSYLKNEPAVMRAIHCDYEPYDQVQYRLSALTANGHEPTKIELIVIGGTWSALPADYQTWFIKECFRGANDFPNSKQQTTNNKKKQTLSNLKTSLQKEQKRNETAVYKIIGLTLETRPDYINEAELWRMRELGATRVELGVQALDDKILKLNRRGSTVADIRQATKLLKNFGFKVTYHFMPALPGSSPAKDLAMYKKMFSGETATLTLALTNKTTATKLAQLVKQALPNNDFNPDQIKFYPTVVVKGSLLYRWWQAGKYKPYSNNALQKLIIACKELTPPFVRIIRLIRDIPGESIVAGNRITNLRQILQQRGVKCRCLRCREIGLQAFTLKDAHLFVSKYRANDADEYFLSFASLDQSKLYGFARLRLGVNAVFPETAWLRELHVYGQLVSPGGHGAKVQHQGLGKRLIKQAEDIARLAGYKKLAMISGVGVRGYYRRLGYKLNKTYMLKNL